MSKNSDGLSIRNWWKSHGPTKHQIGRNSWVLIFHIKLIIISNSTNELAVMRTLQWGNSRKTVTAYHSTDFWARTWRRSFPLWVKNYSFHTPYFTCVRIRREGKNVAWEQDMSSLVPEKSQRPESRGHPLSILLLLPKSNNVLFHPHSRTAWEK